MHDNSISDIIKILAGIVLALLLVAAIFALWNRAQGGIDKAGDKLGEMNERLSTEDYVSLDGRSDVSGAEVNEFLTNHKEDWGITITVSKTAGAGDILKIDDTARGDYSALQKAISESKDKTKTAKYINPNSKFTVSVTYASDRTITGIDFKKN